MLIDRNELKQILSKNIKSARLSSNLTQECLAEMADISVTFLKDIESGKSAMSLVKFVNICYALSITPNELLKDFFKESFNNSKYAVQQIEFLNEYQKNAVYTLIQYFNDNEIAYLK